MKKIIAIIVVVAAGAVLWHYSLPIENYFQKSTKSVVSNLASSTLVTEIQNAAKQVSAPPPLRGSGSQSGALTLEGVISWTNINRAENGNLPPLKENATLDAEAASKLADMFKQQYFEHINPQGKGPSDLAQAAGYDYISIGENLALGNFGSDQALLTAWMNSPGHRANILNKKYLEIGVAVGQGMYQGQETWLAVQEFGQPASSCPSVDANLKAQIDALQAEVNQIQPQLDALKSQMDSSHPQSQADYDAYNQLVAQYNALVKIYNNKVDSLKLDSDQYNGEVNAYNTCASG